MACMILCTFIYLVCIVLNITQLHPCILVCVATVDIEFVPQANNCVQKLLKRGREAKWEERETPLFFIFWAELFIPC